MMPNYKLYLYMFEAVRFVYLKKSGELTPNISPGKIFKEKILRTSGK